MQRGGSRVPQAAKEAAEERTAQLAGRRKTVMQEKRQKKEQKQEAERHEKLVEALVRAPPGGLPFVARTAVRGARENLRNTPQQGARWSRGRGHSKAGHGRDNGVTEGAQRALLRCRLISRWSTSCGSCTTSTSRCGWSGGSGGSTGRRW